MRLKSLIAGLIGLGAASPAIHADSSPAPHAMLPTSAMSFSSTQTKGFIEQARFFLPSVLGAEGGKVRNSVGPVTPGRDEAVSADQPAAAQTAGWQGVALALAAVGAVGFVARRRRDG